jgi:hypothetical protein
MRCLHCGKRLSLFKKLQDSGFCSEEHRLAFQQQQSDFALARLMEAQRRIDRPGSAQPAPAAAPAPAPAPVAKKAKEKTNDAQPAVPFAGLLGIATAVASVRRCQISRCAPVFTHECFLPQEEPKLPPVHFTTMDPVATMQVAGPPARCREFLPAQLNPVPTGPRLEMARVKTAVPTAERLPLSALVPRPAGRLVLSACPAAFTLRRRIQIPPARLRTLAPVLEEMVEKLPAEAPQAAWPYEPPVRTLRLRAMRLGRMRLIKIGPVFESTVPSWGVPSAEPGLRASDGLQPVPTMTATFAGTVAVIAPLAQAPALAPALPEFLAIVTSHANLRAVEQQAALAAPAPRAAGRAAAIQFAPAFGIDGLLAVPRLAAALLKSAEAFQALRPLAAIPAAAPLARKSELRGSAPWGVTPSAPQLPLLKSSVERGGLDPASPDKVLPVSASQPISLSSELRGPGPWGVGPSAPQLPLLRQVERGGLDPASPDKVLPISASNPISLSSELRGPGPWGVVPPAPQLPLLKEAARSLDPATAHKVLAIPAGEPIAGFPASRLVDAMPAGAASVAPALPAAHLRTLDTDAAPADAPFFDRQLPIHPGRPHAPVVEIRKCEDKPSISTASKPFVPRLRFALDRPDGSGPEPDFLRHRFGDRFRGWWPPSMPGMAVLRAAPADLKWIGVGLPVVLLLLIYSALPSRTHRASTSVPAPPQAAVVETETAPANLKVSNPPAVAAPAPAPGPVLTPAGTPAVPASRWNNFQQAVSSRAAINLTDDFRSGLGAWQGQGKWADSWKYSQAQFVEPGALALYSPTLPMADYSFEFLGQIGRRSLNWVFRAKDFKNYYAMRLVITKPGPLPQASIIRYAVIDGKEVSVKTLPLPLPIKGDTLYRVRMEIKGDSFTTYVQGQVVDNFTDDRLTTGGIGFFTPQGDRTLLRWVEVSYQYDFLGRLCALVAPYGVPADGRISE